MEDYREKLEKHIKSTKFDKLDKFTQEFLKTEALKYRFTFMEFKELVDMSIDLHMWDEKPLHVVWEEKENKKKLFYM